MMLTYSSDSTIYRYMCILVSHALNLREDDVGHASRPIF